MMAILSHLHTASYCEGVAHGRSAVRCVQPPIVIQRMHQLQADKTKFSVGNLNVGTMRGRSGEAVKMLTKRAVDLCCIQKSRWRGASARTND
mgnify:CR=1 FL=1